MAISRNPTRTRTIEKNWNREINRRWKAFTRSAVSRLRSENTGIIVNDDADPPFLLNPTRQRAYMVFLEEEVNRLLLEAEQAPNWQGRYQLQAYIRGLDSTRSELISQGSAITPTAEEVIEAQGFRVMTDAASRASLQAPVHLEGLAFLYQRSYKRLNGWTDVMAEETRQILFDSFAQGQGIEKTVRQMVERIDVSRSRARTIARTETNQAYARSSIAEVQRASEEIGEEVKLRWLTALDVKVRHSHASVHGIVMTPERAYAIKANDGINCRCGLAPVIPRADTAKKRAKFKTEREQLLAIERK